MSDRGLIIPERGKPVSANQLLRIEREAHALVAEINDFDVLEEWRSQARALEAYLRDKDLQGPMLGVARRCEARIGQLLGPTSEGGNETPHHDEGLRKGVEHGQDRSDFRILAHALNGTCPLAFEDWRKSRRALVSLVRNRMGLVPEMVALPDGIFRCIVADPPWQQDTGPDAWGTTGESGHDALSYAQMSLDRIKAMPVERHAADDAHLYLWTINRYIEQAYEVVRAWGFQPSVLLTWAKTPHGVGLGDAFRLTTEFILYARRGSLEESRICPTTWFNWPRGIHSRKPDEFYELVESMTPAPHGERDRLELFARRERTGWTAWGDEIASEQINAAVA